MSAHRLVSQLERLGDLDIEKAVKKGAEHAQSAAKSLAPVNSGELHNSILVDVKKISSGKYEGIVYTNLSYATYVEFGTGPVGAKNHEGTSPNVTPVYTMHAWGIPADSVSPTTAARYGWKLSTYKGKQYYAFPFYGQPAQPFMYPALKDNEEDIVEIIANELRAEVKKCVT